MPWYIWIIFGYFLGDAVNNYFGLNILGHIISALKWVAGLFGKKAAA